ARVCLVMIFTFAESVPKCSVIGRLDDIQQVLLIAQLALRNVRRYRQSTPWASEAGGQLFGTINAGQVCITGASGPYIGDERTRYRYRSNPVAAQRAIEDRH